MAEPIGGYVLPQQFYMLYMLSVGTSPVFVPVIECEIRVRKHKRTVLSNANLWLCLQDSCLYSATTSGSVMFCSGSIHSLILLQNCTIDVIKNG